MSALSRATTGVIPIVPTPFLPDGSINFSDIPRLVDYYRRCGVVGLTILGVMGEAQKLSASETLDVLRAFLAAAGELPVIVGVSGTSLAGPMEVGEQAVGAGAAGVMLQPMTGLAGDAAVVEYFTKFAERTQGRVPVCVQDYPQASGVTITVDAWCAISKLPAVFMLKHEPPAGLGKLSAIRAAESAGKAERVAILTSQNALHLPQELERGADGAMVGVAVTDVVRTVVDLFRAGDRTRAFDVFDAVLPLIRHETQGAFGLAVRKEILRRRGALSDGSLRYPAAKLNATDLGELDRLLERAVARLDALGLSFAL